MSTLPQLDLDTGFNKLREVPQEYTEKGLGFRYHVYDLIITTVVADFI